jgi:hypothetical protein
MSFLRQKLNSYPHNLSFDCELWGWLQSKRHHDGMLVPLSAVITKYLRDEIAKESCQKPLKKQVGRPKKANSVASTTTDWNLEVTDKTPAWVRSIAKKLDSTR